MPIELTLTPQEPSLVNPRLLVLYGKEKIGKSTLLSFKFDPVFAATVYTIVTDPKGHGYLKSNHVQVDNMAEFDEACVKIIALRREGKFPFKRVAVDTVSMVDEWADELGTKAYKASPQGVNFRGVSVHELPNGAGYKWSHDQFRKRLNVIEQLAEEVILVGHVKEFVREDAQKEAIDGNTSTKDLDVCGQRKGMVTKRWDTTGLLNRRPAPTAEDPKATKVWVSFRTKETVGCGCRATHLHGQEFEFDWNKVYLPEVGTPPAITTL